MQNSEAGQACVNILGFPHPLWISSGPFGYVQVHGARVCALSVMAFSTENTQAELSFQAFDLALPSPNNWQHLLIMNY